MIISPSEAISLAQNDFCIFLLHGTGAGKGFWKCAFYEGMELRNPDLTTITVGSLSQYPFDPPIFCHAINRIITERPDQVIYNSAIRHTDTLPQMQALANMVGLRLVVVDNFVEPTPPAKCHLRPAAEDF